jgi:hypothetical protein
MRTIVPGRAALADLRSKITAADYAIMVRVSAASSPGQDRAMPVLDRAGLAFAAERQGIVPSATQVLSFKVAPILGAAIAVENIEVMDFEVIVHITGQLHRQVRDMPPGTRISGFTIAPPPSPSGQG